MEQFENIIKTTIEAADKNKNQIIEPSEVKLDREYSERLSRLRKICDNRFKDGEGKQKYEALETAIDNVLDAYHNSKPPKYLTVTSEFILQKWIAESEAPGGNKPDKKTPEKPPTKPENKSPVNPIPETDPATKRFGKAEREGEAQKIWNSYNREQKRAILKAAREVTPEVTPEQERRLKQLDLVVMMLKYRGPAMGLFGRTMQVAAQRDIQTMMLNYNSTLRQVSSLIQNNPNLTLSDALFKAGVGNLEGEFKKEGFDLKECSTDQFLLVQKAQLVEVIRKNAKGFQNDPVLLEHFDMAQSLCQEELNTLFESTLKFEFGKGKGELKNYTKKYTDKDTLMEVPERLMINGKEVRQPVYKELYDAAVHNISGKIPTFEDIKQKNPTLNEIAIRKYQNEVSGSMITQEYITLKNKVAADIIEDKDLSKSWQPGDRALFEEYKSIVGMGGMSDKTWELVKSEFIKNAPQMIASGAIAGIAVRGAASGLSYGARFVLGAVHVERVAMGASCVSRMAEGAVRLKRIVEISGRSGQLLAGAAGLAFEGAVFETAQTAIGEGNWIGSSPDWAKKIMWSTIGLGVFKGAGKLGGRLFEKPMRNAAGEVMKEGGKVMTEKALIGKWIDRIPDSVTKVVNGVEKGAIDYRPLKNGIRGLIEAHTEVAAMLVIGAIQNGVAAGNLDEFIDNFGEEIFHAYISVGALKTSGKGVEVVRGKFFELGKEKEISPEGAKKRGLVKSLLEKIKDRSKKETKTKRGEEKTKEESKDKEPKAEKMTPEHAAETKGKTTEPEAASKEKVAKAPESNDRDDRDVEKISQKNGVTFVHGIHPNFTPGENSLLKNDVSWATKLKILLSFGPTISTSTVRPGNNLNNLWSRMGVVLKGGSVESAHVSDAGSVSSSLKSRTSSGSAEGPTKESIERAIAGDQTGYNELVVENPEVAGLYVCLDDTGDVTRKDLVPMQEIQKAAQELGLPVYVMIKGELYEGKMEQVPEKRVEHRDAYSIIPAHVELVQGRKLTNEEVAKSGHSLDEGQKKQIRKELMEKSPFNIKNAERSWIDCKNNGTELYTRLNALKSKDTAHEPESYKGNHSETGAHIPEGAPIKRIEKFFETNGDEVEYILHEKTLYKKTTNPRTGEAHVSNVRDIDHERFGNIHIKNKMSVTLSAGSISENTVYLEGMKTKLNEYSKKLEGAGEQKDFYSDIIKQLCFHLSGFSEAARKTGDTETEAAALKIIGEFIPQQEIDRVLTSRIDGNGRFVVTPKDLGGIDDIADQVKKRDAEGKTPGETKGKSIEAESGKPPTIADFEAAVQKEGKNFDVKKALENNPQAEDSIFKGLLEQKAGKIDEAVQQRVNDGKWKAEDVKGLTTEQKFAKLLGVDALTGKQKSAIIRSHFVAAEGRIGVVDPPPYTPAELKAKSKPLREISKDGKPLFSFDKANDQLRVLMEETQMTGFVGELIDSGSGKPKEPPRPALAAEMANTLELLERNGMGQYAAELKDMGAQFSGLTGAPLKTLDQRVAYGRKIRAVLYGADVLTSRFGTVPVKTLGINMATGEVKVRNPKTGQVESIPFREISLSRAEAEQRARPEDAEKKVVMREKSALSQEQFNALFPDAGHEVGQIKQQNTGTCYILAVINSLRLSPHFEFLMKKSITPDGKGGFKVRMPLGDPVGTEITVIPSDLQPQRNPNRGKPDKKTGVIDTREFLLPAEGATGYKILEAAYIRLKQPNGPSQPLNRLAMEGGLGQQAVMDFIGKKVGQLKLIGGFREGLQGVTPESIQSSRARVIDFLDKFDPRTDIATINSPQSVQGDAGRISSAGREFATSHVYSIVSVDRQSRTVKVANPWETNKIISLSYKQFMDTFVRVDAVKIDAQKLNAQGAMET